MMSFATRRWIACLLLVAASVGALVAYFKYRGDIPRLSFISGWFFLLIILLLTAYNGRKKLPFLPVLSSELWLQFHIYAGWFSAVLFLIHINFRVPTGAFEMILALLYLAVTLSGIGGLVLSRIIPKRLTVRGGEVLFERIPAVRVRLKNEVESLALAALPEVKSSTIAEFYVEHLNDFFSGPRNLWRHALESRRPLNSLLARIDDLNRYLGEKERECLRRISELVRQKDGLDYHQSLQWMLKAWLFVHIPLTYSLLIFTFLHVVLVFGFSGGAS